MEISKLRVHLQALGQGRRVGFPYGIPAVRVFRARPMNADLVLTETAASNAGAGVPMTDAARDTDLTLTQPAPCAVPAAGAFVSLIEGGQPMFEGQPQSDVEALLKTAVDEIAQALGLAALDLRLSMPAGDEGTAPGEAAAPEQASLPIEPLDEAQGQVDEGGTEHGAG